MMFYMARKVMTYLMEPIIRMNYTEVLVMIRCMVGVVMIIWKVVMVTTYCMAMIRMTRY